MTTKPLRVPISIASRKGVSWLSDTAQDRPIVLTKHGRAYSTVDTAGKLEESALRVAEATRAVVEHFADRAAGKANFVDLDVLCDKLGIDRDAVSARAAELPNE